LGTISAPTAPAAEPENASSGPQPAEGEGQDGNGDGEAEFEFRLFSSSTAAPKVVLASEEEEKPYTGPAISQRHVSHYIRGELSPHEREQFARAAVTGQDVLAWAGQRAWGLEVPWRVTKISLVVNGKGLADGQQRVAGVEEGKTKKKRLGKKGRIVLRKREKVKKEAAAAAERQKITKEEHLKEKKQRLNRERKLKRRQKEREKKAAARGAGGAEEAAGSGSEGGSDGEE